jgi:aminoglycoside 2'-N-acetyltransferase I
MSSRRVATEVAIGVAHTAQLTPAVLRAARELLDLAFAGGFDDADWEHTLGGVHITASAERHLIGHAAVTQRSLTIGHRAFRVGYVEGVGVRPAWQRRGVGGTLMTYVEQVVRDAYDFGALAATDAALTLYQRRGWLTWRGPLGALSPAGPVLTPEAAGGVLILPGAVTPDLDARLLCDWRNGDLW